MCRVFLMGGRFTSEKIRPLLYEAIEKHITEYGANSFFVGSRGAFDSLAIGVLRELKEQYPHIMLYQIEPYALTKPNAEAPQGFALYYPNIEKVPLPLAIVEANKQIVKTSDYLIICPSAVGNSRKLLEFAQKREKKGLIKITLIENF